MDSRSPHDARPSDSLPLRAPLLAGRYAARPHARLRRWNWRGDGFHDSDRNEAAKLRPATGGQKSGLDSRAGKSKTTWASADGVSAACEQSSTVHARRTCLAMRPGGQSPAMQSEPASDVHLFRLAVLFEGGAVVALLLGWMVSAPATQTLHWSAAGWGWGALASLPLLAVMLLVTHFPFGPLARLNRLVSEVIVPLVRHSSVLEFLTISLLAGVGEELLFRGVLQALLARWTTPVVGLALASLLFGLATCAQRVIRRVGDAVWRVPGGDLAGQRQPAGGNRGPRPL